MLDVKGSIHMSNAKSNQCAEVSTIERCIRSARTRPSCISGCGDADRAVWPFPSSSASISARSPDDQAPGSRPVPYRTDHDQAARGYCHAFAPACARHRYDHRRCGSPGCCGPAGAGQPSWLSVKLATPTSSLNFASLDCLRPSLSRSMPFWFRTAVGGSAGQTH